ncbi:MAG: hypothetical protein GC185_12290 [Alphaproteobacteria bacterium]|nr:hypothetical protein [Alphaproteobacteria bacterium]
MPSYRGIEQADLVKTLNDALELLENHSIGPVCQSRIDDLRKTDPATGQSPLGGIAAAKDTKELVQALRGSGATGLLLFVAPVMQYHGLADTDGKGREVFKALNETGVMNGARMLAYTPLDAEKDSFLAAEYAKRAAAAGGLKKISSLFKQAAMLGGDGVSGARHFGKLVRMARKGADDAALKQAFLKLDLRERHQLVDAGAIACGMHWAQNREFLSSGVMDRFGLVVPELKDGTLNWASDEMTALAEKVGKILSPFYESDEVQMQGIGMITNDRDGPQGVMFVSTRRAAQAVADAFPQSQVVDSKTQPVTPKGGKPQAGKGFNL